IAVDPEALIRLPALFFEEQRLVAPRAPIRAKLSPPLRGARLAISQPEAQPIRARAAQQEPVRKNGELCKAVVAAQRPQQHDRAQVDEEQLEAVGAVPADQDIAGVEVAVP